MLKTDKTALGAALSVVKSIVKPNAKIQALQHILVERGAAEDGLIARGGDPDMEIAANFQALVGEDFRPFLAPAQSFADFVRNAPDPQVSIEPVISDGVFSHITLRSARSRLKLPILPADIFPRLDGDALEHGLTLSASVLRDALKAVRHAASVDTAEYFLCGVLFEPGESGLTLVATDRLKLERRLIRKNAFDDDAPLAGLPRIVVGNSVAARLADLAGDVEDVTIGWSDQQIRVTAGNTVMVGKLIDCSFPEWRRIVGFPQLNRAVLDTAPLAEAIGRVLLATPDTGNGVTFRFEGGSLRLVARDASLSEGEDVVEAEIEQPAVVGLHGRNVQAVIEHMSGNRAELLFGEQSHPIRMRPVGDEENFSCLMPLHPKGGYA